MDVLGFISFAVWIVGIVLVLGALAVSIVARRINEPLIALVALLPVGLATVMIAFQFTIPAPAHFLNVLAALSFAGLAVFAGGPLTTLVLKRAARGQQDGQFGGILVKEKGDRSSREVLRGGAAIGYLERTAIVAAIAVGHPEVVAAVIAIKGLGRFSELDNAEARERFIIGTLTSFLWAGACAAAIVLPGGVLG
jgi:hypothetical protein